MKSSQKFLFASGIGLLFITSTLLADEECHYLAFSDKTKEFHVWITTGDTPLVKHYRVIDKTSKNNAYKSTTIYWENASSISASDFVFTAPKDAQEAFIKNTHERCTQRVNRC